MKPNRTTSESRIDWGLTIFPLVAIGLLAALLILFLCQGNREPARFSGQRYRICLYYFRTGRPVDFPVYRLLPVGEDPAGKAGKAPLQQFQLGNDDFYLHHGCGYPVLGAD